jgi:two-component system NarL family response regulator
LDLRVVVCDDHALYRRGLIMELDEADDLEVVGEASNGAEAVDSCARVAPDVVLMDVRMPEMDGIEATRRIVEAMPSARVLMLTVSDEGDDLIDAIKAGASGYLLKELSISAIASAVRSVAAGHSFISPPMATKLLSEFRSLAGHPGGSLSSNGSTGLTEREILVLDAMAEGHNNCEIASRLHVPERTVHNHVRNVLQKLQLHSRTEAVLYAVREGLIDP